MLGLAVGLLGVVSGGRMQRSGPILEFYGGLTEKLLKRFPGGPGAMTLGHVVVGRDREILDYARSHEMIHVAQYERWGPFFIPAYLLSSLYLMCRRKNPYYDNPFEREAYEKDGR